MRRGLILEALLIASCGLFAQDTKGIKPRAAVGEYAAVSDQPTFALGAERLSPDEVRRTFVSDLSKNYVVLEVGAFPKSDLQLSPQDFMLVVRGQKNVSRPADPEIIAAKLGKKETSGKDVSVSPVAGVTYSTGNSADPAYPNKGWTTTTGSMVNIGPPNRAPQTVDADRRTMAAELKDKELPGGSSAKPVAGYLYFPASSKKDVQYDLEYRSGNVSVVIPLAPAAQ
jgi:hypothetical protein